METVVLERGESKQFRRHSKNVRDYVREFCEITTIQGPANIVKKTTTWERLWWISIFVLGIIGSCIMVYQICDKYVTTPVLVSLATKEQNVWEIPFPSVTICPQAKVATKCVNYTDVLLRRREGNIVDIGPKPNERFDYMSLLCKSENHEGTFSMLTEALDLENLAKTENSSLALAFKELFEVLQGYFLDDYATFLRNCSTVDLQQTHCEWMGAKVNCADVLTPILTERGLCYSFNMYDVRDIYSDLNEMEYFPESVRRIDWFPDKGYSKQTDNIELLYPRRAFLSGANNAFVAVFFTHHDDINYACEDFAIQGLQVQLHTPTRIPRPERIFFSVGLDSLTTAAVSPTYTETSNKIKNYDPSKRFCYFENERKLKYFKFYSQSNCNFECFINFTINECGCVNFYMPHDNETRVCALNERFCLQDARTNYAEDILKERLDNFRSNSTTSCHCIPLCADLTYNTDITQSDWDWKNLDEIQFDSHNRSELDMYHASGIKVFFKDVFFLPSLRDELYGTTDMISNIGGILSLFVGASLITSAEIIFFLSFKLIDNYYRYGYCLGTQK